MRTLPLSFAAALFATTAFAASPDVTASGAWARASAGAASTGAAYLAITAGNHDERLTSVSTPVAQSAQVHESTNEGGIMRMRAINELDIPPGKTVTLSPGGYHVMMFGLHHPLKAGQNFPLTLNFAHAAPVTVTVTVRPIGAAAMQDHPAGNMPMDHGAMGNMGNMPMDHGSMGKMQ